MFDKLSNRTIGIFIVRWIFGILQLVKGWYKTFEMTPLGHARRYFIEGSEDYWMPEPLLYAVGASIPIVELAAGLLICIGIFTRHALAAIGLVLIITTYGHALNDPLFNPSGHTLAYLVMMMFLWIMPQEEDRLSLSHWLRTRKND